MGYPLSMRRALFDLICDGVGMRCATGQLGVSYGVGRVWWYQAGAMRLKVGRDGGGLVMPGVPDTPGGLGHRLGRDEQIMIMRLRDQGMMQADIARASYGIPTVLRELKRNANADGDYHAGMAHGRAAERARRRSGSSWPTIR
jgi:transposase, IS30 family